MPFNRAEFQQLLLKCQRIIRNNDKLSPEAVFDELAKILFIKTHYEKENGKESRFTRSRFKQLEKKHNHALGPFIDHLFNETKAEFDRYALFDTNETIRLKQESFEGIVSALEKYNLADSTVDIKGIAFEELLEKSFRGKLGQFLTPRPIVDFMVKILDPGVNDRVCDPACGSGGFLIKVLQHVKEKTKKDICTVNFFGVDANPRMARVAKMNMVLHGGGCGGVYHHDGLLDTAGIFENRFDLILTNPPFGARVSRTVTDAMPYDLGKVSRCSEVLFLERCLRLLKPGGRMGIVLPEGVLASDNMQKVRDYVEDRAKLLLVVSLPREVFLSSGAAVKTGVVFLRKFTEGEALHYSELVRIYRGVRENVKHRFNYTIFIADVRYAGIDRTGGPCENQLPAIAEEYALFGRTGGGKGRMLSNSLI